MGPQHMNPSCDFYGAVLANGGVNLPVLEGAIYRICNAAANNFPVLQAKLFNLIWVLMHAFVMRRDDARHGNVQAA